MMDSKPFKPRRQSDFDVLKKVTNVDGTLQISADDTLATHAVIQESQVDVILEIERPTDRFDLRSIEDRRVIRVKLWSLKRPYMNTSTCLRVTGKSQSEMAKACEYAAAVLAEAQCGLYGDPHDTVACAKAGRRHYEELCKHLASRAA